MCFRGQSCRGFRGAVLMTVINIVSFFLRHNAGWATATGSGNSIETFCNKNRFPLYWRASRNWTLTVHKTQRLKSLFQSPWQPLITTITGVGMYSCRFPFGRVFTCCSYNLRRQGDEWCPEGRNNLPEALVSAEGLLIAGEDRRWEAICSFIIYKRVFSLTL